jgi:hypothetical protein
MASGAALFHLMTRCSWNASPSTKIILLEVHTATTVLSDL